MLSDLLSYDKIESGTFQLEISLVPIWQLIERTANEFRLAAAKKNLQFVLVFGDSTVDNNKEDQDGKEEAAMVTAAANLSDEFKQRVLAGDKVRISQVLRNLVSNALKFTPEEGAITIQATWLRETKAGRRKTEEWESITLKDGEVVSLPRSGCVQIKVTDTGAGMSAEQLQQLYGDGVQFNVEELQRGGGSGLGLFITKGIVQQHQGTLLAESDGLKKGASFTLTFPLHCKPKNDLKQSTHSTKSFDENASANISERTPERMHLHVLIVEDVVSNRKLLARMLSIHGHSYEEAENGAVAVEMVSRSNTDGTQFDIVLMDYEMPIMSGPESVKEIRRRGFDVLVVGVTGNVLGDDVAFFKASGADAVLAKPFKIADFDDVCVEAGLL